jgi:hypothetical protein
MAIMADRCLGRLVEIAQRPLGAVDPVAILGARQVDQLVGDAEHLQELPRGFALVRRGSCRKTRIASDSVTSTPAGSGSVGGVPALGGVGRR